MSPRCFRTYLILEQVSRKKTKHANTSTERMGGEEWSAKEWADYYRSLADSLEFEEQGNEKGSQKESDNVFA